MRLLLDIYRFTRFSAAGASLVLPLLGAGIAGRNPSPRQLARLLSVAAAFHLFAYVDNDLCDLELDRGQPLRAAYPLVRGAISRPTARLISLAALTTAFLITGTNQRNNNCTLRQPSFPLPLRSQPSALSPQPSALLLAFILMALYNRYGKRCPVPPLTDAVQGLSWAALIAYGADGRIARPTALLMLHELLLILLVNGVHGPLRDLANDAQNGARTTALWFGAHVTPSGALYVPPLLALYALALQAGMAGSLLAAWRASKPRRRPALAGLGSCLGLIVALLAAAAYRRAPASVVGMLHLILILSAPVALVAPLLPAPARTALLTAHIGPLLANGLTYDALRWLGSSRAKAGEP